jgi:predicted ATPase
VISAIQLKAFKSYPDAKIPFKPLTLLSGLNNSGKSSLIQAVRMYQQAANGQSPLLENHGEVSDMRSRFSSLLAAIEITCVFTDGISSRLHLNDDVLEKPERCPVSFYVSADRLGPQTVLPLRRAFSALPDMGEQSRYVLDVLGRLHNAWIPDALAHPKAQSKSLQHVLDGWLSEIAPGIGFSFEPDPKADAARAEIDTFRPINVGFGLSYTLPILVAILGMAAQAPETGWENNWGESWDAKRQSEGTLVILENPEAHLHPQGQTAMGRLLALAAASGIQVLVETHSDHLMDGIRLAVKEGLVDADNIAFHYLNKNKDGMTEVKSPKIYQNGKLDFWPDGFFDQALKNSALLAKRG